MKSIIITFIISFFMITCLKGQWKIINEGIEFYAVDFINNDTGWILSGNSIHKTIDGGKNWTLLNDSLSFRTIDYINDSLGWAIDNSAILKTMDGGLNWVRQKSFDYDLETLCVVTENVVYAIGDRIFKTTDGGKTWNKKIMPEYELFNVKFIDDSTGYFLAKGSADKYLICKTTDMFSTWSVVTEINYRISDFHFLNDNVIISIMQDSTGANIIKTIKGGRTWRKVAVLPAGLGAAYRASNEIYFGTENVGYVFLKQFQGNADVIMKSIDQGDSWSLMNLNISLSDVYFINRNKGFITGLIFPYHTRGMRYGNIFMTNDGGKSWNLVLTTGQMNSTCPAVFTNNRNGFISGGKGKVYQTMDGGDSWFEKNLFDDNEDFIPEIKNIFFVNESIGYITTKRKYYDESLLYKTTNGGDLWEKIFDCDNCYLNSTFFINERIGLTVGENGLIFKYTVDNEWKEINSYTDLPLNKVFFADITTGWIAGGYISNDGFKPLLLKTDDGGESWFKIDSINYLINDFYFKDKYHGWAVGENSISRGVILETTDGGNDWTVEVDSLSAPLEAIHYKDGICWAVGKNGLILKTIDSTYTSIPEYQNTDNAKTLLQNYPNPLNSKTVISYQTVKNGQIELIVYDLMGREITVLVNKRQQAGKYEVAWNATGIKPGIYFGELKAGQSRKVIKMVLLSK